MDRIEKNSTWIESAKMKIRAAPVWTNYAAKCADNSEESKWLYTDYVNKKNKSDAGTG